MSASAADMKQQTSHGGRQPNARERRLGRPSREQIQEIEQRLLDSAIKIFLEQGPAVPMKAIVDASGLSSKTVYSRYSNKDALFLAALRKLLGSTPPLIEMKFSPDENVRDVLREFVLTSLRVAYRPESVALNRMVNLYPGFARELTEDFHRAIDRIFRVPLRSYLQNAQAFGRLRAVDLDMTTQAVLTLVLSEPASRFADQLPAPVAAEMEARADFVTDLVADGIMNGASNK